MAQPTHSAMAPAHRLQSSACGSVRPRHLPERGHARRYFVAFAVDTSLGVAVAVGLHMLVVRLCQRRAAALPASPWAAWYQHVSECGSYGALHVEAFAEW